MDRAVFKHAGKHLKTRQRLSCCHDTAGIPVQTVADRRAERAQPALRELAAPQKIIDQILHQRFIGLLSLLRQHTRRFVDQNDLIILIENIEIYFLYLLHLNTGKFFNGVIREKQLHDIAFGEFFISLTLFPVQRDVLLAHHLIEKALRRLIHVLRKELIQALSRLVLLNHDLSHFFIPLHGKTL